MIDWKKLQEPFPPEDIEFRVQQSGLKGDKPWVMVLAYVTNRAIQHRLDEVVGPENWRNEYSRAPDDGVLCGLSIRVERKVSQPEWVTKYDGAENTQVEAVKGGLSGAMKRAAVQWGIGRYLYQLESTFAQTSKTKDAAHTEYLSIKDRDHKVVWSGYWAIPKLPEWALPSPKPVKKPASALTPDPVNMKNAKPSVTYDKPPAQRFGEPLKLDPSKQISSLDEIRAEPADEPAISAEQAIELMKLAKAKGYTDKATAIKFINERSGMDNYTQLPVSLFESVKKSIIEAGWKKPDASDGEVKL